MSLELDEYAIDISFTLETIHPGEFTKIVNETHIVFKTTKGGARRPPNIGENKFKR